MRILGIEMVLAYRPQANRNIGWTRYSCGTQQGFKALRDHWSFRRRDPRRCRLNSQPRSRPPCSSISQNSGLPTIIRVLVNGR